MADKPINLDDFRQKPDGRYPDVGPLCDAVDLILNAAHPINKIDKLLPWNIELNS